MVKTEIIEKMLAINDRYPHKHVIYLLKLSSHPKRSEFPDLFLLFFFLFSLMNDQ